GFIFFLDMWRIEKNFIKTVPHPAKYFAPDEAVHVLREDKSLFRVYPLEYRSDNYLMLFDIQSIGGEHGNQLRRYQEFIGAEKTVMFSPTNLFYPNILNLLNVKYVIMPNFDLSQIPDFHPDPTIDATIKTIRLIINPAYFKLFYQGQRLRIFENLHFLPRVFLVPQYQIINDDKRIMATIKSDTYNPRKTVILEINPGVPQFEDTIIQGQVQITSYKPDRIEIEANLHNPGFLVLTDNFYPLWQAKVDGKKTTVYRADYTSRAIYLPVGKHEIIFYFDSPYFRIGTLISIMTFIVSLIIITINIRKKSY
ncbi:MAG: YfhO family protein, partial [candidate division WOR-3 bacterium]